MSYDHWKTTEDDPGDDYPFFAPEDDCDHADYEADILTGRAWCNFCGHAWWQTSEEISAEIERIRAYSEWMEDQERPWVRFKEWIRGWWFAIKPRWPRRRAKIVDDIPF